MRLPLLLVVGVAGVVASLRGPSTPERDQPFGGPGSGAPSASRGVPLAEAPQDPQLPRLTPFQEARVERMLNSRVACLGCHRLRGRGGRIGPSLDGLGDRAAPAYVFGVIREPSGMVPGTMMPAQPMAPRDAERLAAYLLSGEAATEPSLSAPDVEPQAPPAISESERNNGAALYARHCAACHGPEGRGDGWNAPTLPVPPTAHADAALMSARPDDTLFDAIAGGAWVLDGSPMMPPFVELLSTEQIRALVRHIRTLCGCEGPAWSRDGVGR